MSIRSTAIISSYAGENPRNLYKPSRQVSHMKPYIVCDSIETCDREIALIDDRMTELHRQKKLTATEKKELMLLRTSHNEIITRRGILETYANVLADFKAMNEEIGEDDDDDDDDDEDEAEDEDDESDDDDGDEDKDGEPKGVDAPKANGLGQSTKEDEEAFLDRLPYVILKTVAHCDKELALIDRRIAELKVKPKLKAAEKKELMMLRTNRNEVTTRRMMIEIQADVVANLQAFEEKYGGEGEEDDDNDYDDDDDGDEEEDDDGEEGEDEDGK